MPDLGHKETDEALGKLERRIKKVYVQAYEETEAKLQDYLSRFATKDKVKQEQLRAGKITQDEYNYWRKGQVMIGKRWQEMVNSLAADYTNANRLAMSMVGDLLPGVYALNHDYGTFQVEKGSMVDTSYTLYDRSTVERLIRDNPNLLPKAKVNIPKDLRWNKQHINNAVLQGILQGESNNKIASRLQTVTGMNHTAAIRNARTMTTGAENAGRTDSYKRAAEMGIELEQEWLATLDGRTRDSHRALDGERIPLAKDKWHPAKFSNGCRYPGDPEGPPWEVYNCRCTLVAAIKGIDQSDAPRDSKLGDMSYEEWKNAHKTKPRAQPTSPVQPTPPVQTAKIKTVEKYAVNTQDLSREEVEETWFDYDYANAIKEYIGTGAFPNTTLSGEKLSTSQKNTLASTAEYIKTEASKNSGYNTLYRGMVLDPDQARVMFNPGSNYTFDNLTSTSKDKGIASIYSSGDSLEYVENGVPVMITIQKPDGIRGMNIMNDAETILPIGSTFKVTKNFMDKDGVIHVEMYLSSKKKQIP